MFERGVAIVYVTSKGSEVAHKIADVLRGSGIKCTVFAPEKHAREGEQPLKGSLSDGVKDIFGLFDAIVGIMATGILIRVITPLLRGKLMDPAVVCVDVAGRFAISLLSGHHGGANHLARLVAAGIGAVPVITTGSDAVGRKSIEEIARSLHCDILNPERLVNVNALIVDERRIVLLFVGFEPSKVPSSIYGYEAFAVKTLEEAHAVLDKFDGGILVVKDTLDVPMDFRKPVILIKPKKIVVGIGARRDASSMEVLEAIKRGLDAVNVPLAFVQALATIEIKKESEGIIAAGEMLGIPVHFINVNEVSKFNRGDLTSESEVVKKYIGVGGVCERAALIAAGRDARLILKKMKLGRVTVAVAEAG